MRAAVIAFALTLGSVSLAQSEEPGRRKMLVRSLPGAEARLQEVVSLGGESLRFRVHDQAPQARGTGVELVLGRAGEPARRFRGVVDPAWVVGDELTIPRGRRVLVFGDPAEAFRVDDPRAAQLLGVAGTKGTLLSVDAVEAGGVLSQVRDVIVLPDGISGPRYTLAPTCPPAEERRGILDAIGGTTEASPVLAGLLARRAAGDPTAADQLAALSAARETRLRRSDLSPEERQSLLAERRAEMQALGPLFEAEKLSEPERRRFLDLGAAQLRAEQAAKLLDQACTPPR